MHLRRALLLFALVLGLTALAASIAPQPRSERSPPPPPEVPSAEPVEAPTVALSLPRNGHRPAVRRLPPGTHVIVTVAAPEPGQATIPRLGRTASVTQSTPASFDVVTPAGRTDVLFRPTVGEPTLAGTIVGAG